MSATPQTRFPSRLNQIGDEPLPLSATIPATPALQERRCESRYRLQQEAVVIPVTADSLPGPSRPGSLCDISRSGIGLRFSSTDPLEAERFVVGLRLEDVTHFAAVDICYSLPEGDGLRVGGRFIEGRRDPLDPLLLTPRFDPRTLRFSPALPPAALSQWLAAGVLQLRTMDRVKACPACRSLPTFRDGCAQCGSSRLVAARSVHHFACGHVGPAEEFEWRGDGSGKPSCPRCQATGLNDGLDVEHSTGPTQCDDCGWTGTEPLVIGECIRCGVRFRGDEAVDEEVTQFWIRRLDPLAFIDGPLNSANGT